VIEWLSNFYPFFISGDGFITCIEPYTDKILEAELVDVLDEINKSSNEVLRHYVYSELGQLSKLLGEQL